jgi:transposase, IS5 family
MRLTFVRQISGKPERKVFNVFVFWGMAEKRRAGQKSLTAGQKKKNRRHSSIRAKVEHPFKVIKAQWGHAKVR